MRISLQGELLADSHDPVLLREGGLPGRWYLPCQDVRVELLDSETTTVCPFKGEARYRSVRLSDGERVEDLVWYYPDPIDSVAEIGDLVCFHGERVDTEVDQAA
ncbi:MAG TPA: DUF427 domain-containing protein [Solirubrobacteraceae bacterium]|nr:DUF427 domain-containing protein [Solirubrobacteraceae bacterium]